MFPLCLAALAAPPAPPEPAARVLARGDGYVISAVPAGPRAPGLDAAAPAGRTRYAILHTDAKTGAITKLVEGGAWAVAGPVTALSTGTSFTLSIAGTAVGPDRLYVVVTHSSQPTMRPDVPGACCGPPMYTQALHVFRLADGRAVQELRLPAPRGPTPGADGDVPGGDLVRLTPPTLTVGAAEYRLGERLTPVEPKP